MHQDFQSVLSLMRKQLKSKRRTSRFISVNSFSADEMLANVKSPSESVRSYEELSDTQQKYFDRLVKKQQQAILSNWKGVIE